MPGKFWIVSLAFHGLVAVLLWCIVFQTTPQASITLSANRAPPSPTAALKFGRTRLDTEVPWGNNATAGTSDLQIEIDTRFDQDFDTDIKAKMAATHFAPNSVEFFGAKAFGNQFVFVLDISYSMKARNGRRYRRAARELIRSVSQLRPDQQYYVLLFSWYTQEMFYREQVGYVRASGDHVQKLESWLNQISLDAGTDPRRALSLALRMKPDAVYLLSDGHFNQPVSPNSETGWFNADEVRTLESVLQGVESRFQGTPIHSIAFENPFTVDAMREIAMKTNGQFRYVRTDSLEPTDLDQLSSALRQLDRQYGQKQAGIAELEARISFARELISCGELVAAEYVLRPVHDMEDTIPGNRVLLNQIIKILKSELNGIQIEDFDVPRDVLITVPDP